MTPTPPRSKTQINKAAKVLRSGWDSPDFVLSEDFANTLDIVDGFRSSFQRPLDKVTIQLRRFVGYETDTVIAAQRLKRLPTIVDKLNRHPNMDLTRMQDIGGCRAVLPSREHVRAVLERMLPHWKIERIDNYIEAPKPTGYRAVHIVVDRDDRLIEIQLRTNSQHDWALAVERIGSRINEPIKDGRGPAEVLRFFELAGLAIALEEQGETVDDALSRELDSLGKEVQAALLRGRRLG